MAEERVEIARSRKKLTCATFGAVGFVLVGVVLLLVADAQDRYDPLLVQAVGLLCVLVFGAAALYGARKLFDRSPGLVLDSEGLVDNASALAAGRVPWGDVQEIGGVTVSGQRFLTIHVRDPETYLRRSSRLKRTMLAMNQRMYGTPLLISAHALQTTFEALEADLRRFHARHGGAQAPTASAAPGVAVTDSSRNGPGSP